MDRSRAATEQKATAPRRIVKYILPDDPKMFGCHLSEQKPATRGFRLRPSITNSSILSRRSRTNIVQLGASSSGSLVPTNNNYVDLVTPGPARPQPPASYLDSGYISGPNQSASPVGLENPPAGNGNVYPHLPADCAPIATDPTNIPEYKATMEQTTEQIFFQKYVSKKFNYDSRAARKRLEPLMKKLLDKPEDRPLVDRLYLHINLKKGTARAERCRERFRHMPGQRAFDHRQAGWEAKDYFRSR